MNETQAAWASVARAVRTPSRFDHDARVNVFIASEDPTVLVAFLRNRSVKSETVLAYELGYRNQLTPTLSLDVATFYNVYHGLVTFDEAEPVFEADPPPGHILVPLLARNRVNAASYGAEVAMQWAPLDHWKLNMSYASLRMRLRPESTYVSAGDNPHNQWQLRSYLDLAHGFELNGALYYVDKLPRLAIESYLRVDLGVVWRAAAGLELGLWGRNLLDERHGEFTSLSTPVRTQIPRTVLGRVVWSYR